jgi:hypothetical protein
MRFATPTALVATLALALTTHALAQTAPSSTSCPVRCDMPSSGLLGWWPGDGNARDVQMRSNGRLKDGAGFASGFVNQAFQFDGVNAYVNVPDTSILRSVTNAVTITAWIRPQLAPSGAAFVFARREPLVTEGYSLFINNDGYLRAQFQTDEYLDVDSQNPVIAYDGSWQHVAVTADGSTGQVVLYLNGSAVPLNYNGTLSGAFAPASQLYIGRRQTADTPEGVAGALNFKGLIDEVQLYNRVLSGREIQRLFLDGARGQCKPRMPE